MPASPDLRLISKIIEKQDFNTVLRERIDRRMLSLQEAKQMYTYIWKYYHNPKHRGAVPKRRRMEDKFPTFRRIHDKETIAEVCEEIRQAAISRALLDLADQIDSRTTENPYKALEHLQTEITKIQSYTNSTNTCVFSDRIEEIKERYQARKNKKGTTGVPFPWKELTEVTGGMQEGDLTILFGPTKNLKTFTAVHMATHAYLNSNCRVLFFSAEMGTVKTEDRLAASVSQVDYADYKLGTLDKEAEEYFNQALDLIKDEEEFVFQQTGHKKSLTYVSIDNEEVATVNDLKAKVAEVKPDIVFVDAFYMLGEKGGKSDLDWKVQAAIVKGLKQLAMSEGIPVVGMCQANSTTDGAANNVNDMAFAKFIGMIADLAIRCTVKSASDFGTRLMMKFAVAREVRSRGFYLDVVPYTRYDFDGWFNDEDEAPVTKTPVKSNDVAGSSNVAKFLEDRKD